VKAAVEPGGDYRIRRGGEVAERHAHRACLRTRRRLEGGIQSPALKGRASARRTDGGKIKRRPIRRRPAGLLLLLLAKGNTRQGDNQKAEKTQHDAKLANQQTTISQYDGLKLDFDLGATTEP